MGYSPCWPFFEFLFLQKNHEYLIKFFSKAELDVECLSL